MSSQRKIDSARANGAKSRGPVTNEGKARSAQNSQRHQLLVHSLVLTSESKEKCGQLLAAYIERFQPEDEVENSLVHQMVTAQWQLERCIGMKAAILDLRLQRDRDKVDKQFKAPPDLGTRSAMAFVAETDQSNALNLLHRYETAHRRAFAQALNTLLKTQANRPGEPQPEIAQLPNEPNSEVEPSAECQANTEAKPENTELRNEPNLKAEHGSKCPCSRIIPPSSISSGYRCRCGRFYKPVR